MKVLGLEFHFDKNVIKRVIMLFLPMVILASAIFLYILPMMRKSIVQEYEGFNKNLLDFVNVQFTQVDEIKANMEKKNFVNRLLYVDSEKLYDKNSDVSDFLDFIDELYNINEISSITSDIGIYNKKNEKVYYTEGINDVDWFFDQTYSIDKKSNGYWTSCFNNVQYENGVQFLGPFDYTYYGVINNDFTKEGFLYVAPINIGSSCQLVFFALIDTDNLVDVKNLVQNDDDTYSVLYYNQNKISLNDENIDVQLLNQNEIPAEVSGYISVTSKITRWNQEFDLVTYVHKKYAYKDVNTMRIFIAVLLLIMFLYIYEFIYILNKKQNEISLRKEKKMLINAFLRSCFNWNDESDLQRISDFYGSYYLFMITEKLNVQDCVEHEGSYNLVVFTCEDNTILAVCSESDDENNIKLFLKEYRNRLNIHQYGISSVCKINEIRVGYSQALDSYDNYSLEEDSEKHLLERNNSIDYQILNYVNENYNDSNLSLKDIAEKFQINVSNISRQFQQVTGEHFRSYLMGLRIKKACELLEKTEDNINIISKLSGYDNPTSFRRIFKQMTGQSPSDFRNKNK